VCNICICNSPLPPSWGPSFFGAVAWFWPSFLQENVEVLGPGDLVQLVDLRMTDLNGEQGYILRLVPGHKEERVEVPRRLMGSLMGAEQFADFPKFGGHFAKKIIEVRGCKWENHVCLCFFWCNIIEYLRTTWAIFHSRLLIYQKVKTGPVTIPYQIIPNRPWTLEGRRLFPLKFANSDLPKITSSP